MAETPSADQERRCRSCGAQLYEGATWCGMCFEPVESTIASTAEDERQPGGRAESPLGGDPGSQPGIDEGQGSSAERITAVAETTTNVPLWPCPVCNGRNTMDLDLCATCGTPFAALMREDQIRPNVEPGTALRRSLLFPGLGHRLVGRTLDGFARGVLFGMLLIATLVLGLSGVSSGPVHSLFLVYASAAVGVYVITALEASRLAQGGELMVSSRILLWTAVAILLLSIVVVSFSIGTSGRR